MSRPSSMEAKQTLRQLMPVALCGLSLALLPMIAAARVSSSGPLLAAFLPGLPPAPPAPSPAEAARARWRKSTKDNMALGEDTVYLRAWKLLSKPLPLTATPEIPDHSEEELDSLVEELHSQPVRFYLPKVKATFQSFDLREHYPNAKESIAYALTSIEAEEPTTATLQLRSANSIRVWINGELVLTQSAPKFGRAVTTTAEITLDPEENIILVECLQGGRTWGFSLGMSNLEKSGLQASIRVAKP
jgi:hypothetical protein